MLRIGVPRETTPGETRVALVPEAAGKLAKAGFAVVVESGAGEGAFHPDSAYREAGAEVSNTAAAFGADVVLKVREPRPLAAGAHEADLIREGALLIAFLDPARNSELLERLARRRVTAYAMERIPRISRAQKMDALSSMSTVAGYKAALLAADTVGRFFPLLMTAAGTIAPARAFVLGAGVAGLQAIATARRLGAVVEAFDVRPAVREEVQSLGATFVAAEHADASLVGAGGYAKEMSADQEERERALIHEHVKHADVVITTAVVPGRRAPVLVTAAMVAGMKAGSVIVDLAAESGGNCELSRPGEVAAVNGVTILAPLNLVSTLPIHASQMYSRNVSTLLLHLVKDGAVALDFADEITRDTCVTHDGEVRFGAAPRTAPENVPA